MTRITTCADCYYEGVNKVSRPVLPLMPEPYVQGPLKPKDDSETLSSADEKGSYIIILLGIVSVCNSIMLITINDDVSVPVPLFMPKQQVHGPLKPKDKDESDILSSADEKKGSYIIHSDYCIRVLCMLITINMKLSPKFQCQSLPMCLYMDL